MGFPPSNTQYEMRLISFQKRPDTTRLLPLKDQPFTFMNQFCSNIRSNTKAEKWTMVKDSDLRIFMDTLLRGDFDLSEDECEDPEASEVTINVPTEISTFADVAYRNIYIWHDGTNAERLAIFEDPTMKAPIVCVRKFVIAIED
jgi:hypothetical protein